MGITEFVEDHITQETERLAQEAEDRERFAQLEAQAVSDAVGFGDFEDFVGETPADRLARIKDAQADVDAYFNAA